MLKEGRVILAYCRVIFLAYFPFVRNFFHLRYITSTNKYILHLRTQFNTYLISAFETCFKLECITIKPIILPMTRLEIAERTRMKAEAKALAAQARKDAATLARTKREEDKALKAQARKDAATLARKEKAEKALHIKELKDQARKEKEDRIQREQIEREFKYGKFDLEKIKELIKRGESNEYIRKGVLYNIRNAPFEISAAVNFRLPFMPNNGKTREHVNGRTAFATYFLWAIAQGEIKSVDDAVMFYKTYCIWILTDDEFNMAIKPFQNEEGAIMPETYIQLYEQTYGTLSDLARKTFQTHFMYTDYGRITRDDLINYFRN